MDEDLGGTNSLLNADKLRRAKRNLMEFLRFYHEKDGWTSNANEVLGRLNNPKIVEDPRRPREP